MYETKDFSHVGYMLYRGIAMLEPVKKQHPYNKTKQDTFFSFADSEETKQAWNDYFLSESKQVSDIIRNVILPLTRN